MSSNYFSAAKAGLLLALAGQATARYDWSELVNMADYSEDWRTLDCF